VYTARTRSCNGHVRGRERGPTRPCTRPVHVRLHGRTQLLHGLETGKYTAVYVYVGHLYTCMYTRAENGRVYGLRRLVHGRITLGIGPHF